MSVRADAESLRRIPLFRDCEAVPLQVLAFAAERERFEPGDQLMSEGKRAAAAYFLLQGVVILRQAGKNLGRAEPGALLGEVAMLSGGAASLTAIADDDVVAVRIDRALFQRVASEYPEFAQAVMKSLSERLNTSVRELESVRMLLTKARSFSAL